MAYEIELADEASADLDSLIDSLPERRRWDATDAVETKLKRLASNPSLAQPRHLNRPTYHFSFEVERVHYYWGCTFCLSQDEKKIRITHIFSRAL